MSELGQQDSSTTKTTRLIPSGWRAKGGVGIYMNFLLGGCRIGLELQLHWGSKRVSVLATRDVEFRAGRNAGL